MRLLLLALGTWTVWKIIQENKQSHPAQDAADSDENSPVS